MRVCGSFGSSHGWYSGYVDNVIISKVPLPEVVVHPDWVLALFFEGPDGSTGVIDSSLYAHTATVTGSEAITTAQQAPRLRSTASLACSAGGYVQYAASSDFKFGTSDWAIEADFLHDATPTASYTDLISVGASEVDNANRVHFSFNNGQLAVYTDTGDWRDLGYTPPVGSWWHARLEHRAGYDAYTRVFVNGQVVWSASNTQDYSEEPVVRICGNFGSSYGWYSGYVDNVIISKTRE